MISKLAIAVAFDVVYIQTAEIFPTSMRATMLSLCSMFGRIGSMLAPQITLVVCDKTIIFPVLSKCTVMVYARVQINYTIAVLR